MDNSDKQNAKFLGKVKAKKYQPNAPWSIQHNHHTSSFEAYDKDGAWRGEFASMEDAQLVAACVNACAGLQIDYLKTANIARDLFPTPDYFIGTENGIADIETPPSDN